MRDARYYSKILSHRNIWNQVLSKSYWTCLMSTKFSCFPRTPCVSNFAGQLLSLPVVFATNMPNLHLMIMLSVQQLYTNLQLWCQPWKCAGAMGAAGQDRASMKLFVQTMVWLKGECCWDISSVFFLANFSQVDWRTLTDKQVKTWRKVWTR